MTNDTKIKMNCKCCEICSDMIQIDIDLDSNMVFTKKHTNKSYKHQIRLISSHRYRSLFECVH